MTRVMLVEDNDSLRSLMTFLLEMEGFEVVTGPTQPDQVFEALIRQRPDVVVLDVHLGGHQAIGLKIVRALRAHPRLRKARVLLISGMDYAFEAQNSGADAFLSKPFMGDELVAKVQTLAQKGPSASQE